MQFRPGAGQGGIGENIGLAHRKSRGARGRRRGGLIDRLVDGEVPHVSAHQLVGLGNNGGQDLPLARGLVPVRHLKVPLVRAGGQVSRVVRQRNSDRLGEHFAVRAELEGLRGRRKPAAFHAFGAFLLLGRAQGFGLLRSGRQQQVRVPLESAFRDVHLYAAGAFALTIALFHQRREVLLAGETAVHTLAAESPAVGQQPFHLNGEVAFGNYLRDFLPAELDHHVADPGHSVEFIAIPGMQFCGEFRIGQDGGHGLAVDGRDLNAGRRRRLPAGL